MVQVSVHPYTLQFKRPAATSRGALTTRPIYFLQATDPAQPGVAGWGECGPLPGLSVDDRPDFGDQVQRVCAAFNAGTPLAQIDLTGLPSLAFGLETALRDWQMGGQQRLFDTPFSRGEAALTTHGLIWMDTPEKVLQQIETKLALGFRVIKLKVGALPIEQECAILAAIRRVHSADQIQIRLDANGAFTPAHALAILARFAPFDIHFLEQPIRPKQWPALAALCAQSPIPLALDEELIGVQQPAQQQALLEAIRPQHLILKPLLLGGLAACEKWIERAQSVGSAWWINSLLEANVGLNALCQWTSALDSQRIHGLGTGQLFTNNLPSPLQLNGPQLRLVPTHRWDFTCLA